MSKRSRNTLPLVTVIIGGKAIQATPQSIRPYAEVCHGEFKGTKVNSPAMAIVGESAVLWPDATKSQGVTSFDKASLGVLASKFLKDEGLTISAAS